MYDYSDFDAAFVRARVAQFRQQVERRVSGSLTEEEFRPLRLMNGLYLQLHTYMLRIAIPYGTISARQMRQLAMVSERWDKGYGHFTTRQNIQFNWPRLSDVPDILDALADVGMHSIQTSGNTVRNVTADPFAGAADDEVTDPRPVAELIRQWSTDHPEFQFLPRKFKIAVTGSPADRALLGAHDIGVHLLREGGEAQGALGARVLVGGGLGRTPLLAVQTRDFVPLPDLLPYIEAVLGVYNAAGRRDNKFKARIKITLREMGEEALRERIEARFATLRGSYPGAMRRLAEITARFAPPPYRSGPTDEGTRADADQAAHRAEPLFRAWADTNLVAHRRADHAIVRISLKAPGATPGDASALQMRVLADLAERYGHDELRIGQDQNVVLPHVHRADLPAVHAALHKAGLATANIGRISDIVSCPGMDYCTLATARSIPVAQGIAARFRALGLEEAIGAMQIKISGCINACGHHHLGHIGILGLERAGVETYQITLGGDPGADMALGERMGPGFSFDEVVSAVERLARCYLELRLSAEETFIEACRRLGTGPFKTALYQEDNRDAA